MNEAMPAWMCELRFRWQIQAFGISLCVSKCASKYLARAAQQH